MNKIVIMVVLLIIITTKLMSQTYLPLSGGTLTGNLSITSGNQVVAPYYGFNSGTPQPGNSSTVAIFPNNTSQTLDVVGWSNGWRFIPGNQSTYPSPVVNFNLNGSAVFGNVNSGLPGGTSAITIKGPNIPNSSASYQDINYSFCGAGSARVRAYRGSSWDTYLQFLTNNGTGDNPTVAMHIDATGKIGIGTTAPGMPLDISNANSAGIYFTKTGTNAGIGSIYNDGALNINAPGTFFQRANNGNNGFAFYGANYSFISVSGTTANFINNSGTSYFNGGNILIGKTTQLNTQYKLDVAGSVRADKVVVNTTGADFVFEPSYKLKPLNEVAAFIQNNHRLPDIESAATMQRSGVDIGENQAKLLQKIEEMTLYLIKQNAKLEEKNNEVTILKKTYKMFYKGLKNWNVKINKRVHYNCFNHLAFSIL